VQNSSKRIFTGVLRSKSTMEAFFVICADSFLLVQCREMEVLRSEYAALKADRAHIQEEVSR
jgi:hypothetical protein